MNRPTGALLRWCRAVLLAAVALLAGLVAHVSAEGLLPGPAALAVIFAVCAVVGAAFLGRPASRWRVVALLVGGQTFVHGSLTALRGHRGDRPTTPVVPRPVLPASWSASAGSRRVGSLMEQYAAHQPAGHHTQLSVPAPLQHLVADMTGQHALMALAHLLAAVVVGLWLAVGERALWGVLTLTTELVGRALEPALTRWAAAVAAGRRLAEATQCRRCLLGWGLVVPPPTAGLLSPCVVRRGPPAPLAD